MRIAWLGWLVVATLLSGCAGDKAPTTSTPVTSSPSATPPVTSTPPAPTSAPGTPGAAEPGNPQPPGVFRTDGGIERLNVTFAPADSPLPGHTKDYAFEAKGAGHLVVQLRIDPGPATAQVAGSGSFVGPGGDDVLTFSTGEVKARDYRIPSAVGAWSLRFSGSTSNTVHVTVVETS